MSEEHIKSIEILLGVSKKDIQEAMEVWVKYPDLPIPMQTQQEMLNKGADGHLSKAWERYIDVKKIDGREPPPAASDEIGYIKGRMIKQPIEVVYDSSEDKYYLYGGNHRLVQAELNEDPFIRAWVQPDKGKIGSDASTSTKNFLKNYEVSTHNFSF